MDSINFDSLDNEGEGGEAAFWKYKALKATEDLHSRPLQALPIIGDCAAIIKKGIDCHLFDPSITIYCLLS